jgi:hypothetical protein
MPKKEAKIAAILSRTSVVINRGKDDGVEKGDTFVIYTQIGPFKDPDDGTDLGTTTKVWGSVAVKTVEDRFCIAETMYVIQANLFNFATLFPTTSIQQELPVKEEQIEKGLSRIEIGFLAKHVKNEKALPAKEPKQIAAAPADPKPKNPKDAGVKPTS